MKVTLTKKTASVKAAAKAKAGVLPVAFNLQDNGDDTFTVLGQDAAGNSVDISGVATLAVTSDNQSLLTVDPPVGMTGAMHAVGPLGSCNLTAVATWTDGSAGPFTIGLPVTLVIGPANKIVINPGVPTVH